MLFKQIDITDSLNIELRKEDGMAQIIVNDNNVSFTIGTLEELNVDKLKELSQSLNDFANYIEEKNYNLKYVLLSEDGKPVKKIYEDSGNICFDVDGYDNLISFNSINDINVSLDKIKQKLPYFDIGLKVELFPRKIGEIIHSLDYPFQNKNFNFEYNFYSNVPKNILHRYNIYDKVIDIIKNYNGGNWDWILQSTSIVKYFPIIYAINKRG